MIVVVYHRATGPRVLRPLRCSSPWVLVSIMNLPNSAMRIAMNIPKVWTSSNLYDRLRSLIDSSDSVPAQNTNPPDSQDRWLRDARQCTDAFNREGFRTPTAWVLTNGHNIPDRVIEGGRENDNTLFIARAYVEVKSSSVISSITRHRNLTRILFDSGRTVYGFPFHITNIGVLV